MEGIHQNMQSFSSAGVLWNSSIFLSSSPKCDDRCHNKAHGQGHLKPGTALKPVWYGRVWPRGWDHLHFSLSGIFSSNFLSYLFFLRTDLNPR